MGEKFDFLDYVHSREVVKDFPSILYILEKLIPALEDKSQYAGVQHLLTAARDSQAILTMQYEYYKKIYEKKGKKDEVRNSAD